VSGGEIEILVLETVLRIRREHASDKAIKAIARDLHLPRKVDRKTSEKITSTTAKAQIGRHG